MDKMEGEAVANNRKGKLIFFYEWDLTITWKGRLNGGDFKEVEGKIHIPNLSEENDVSEVEVRQYIYFLQYLCFFFSSLGIYLLLM